MLLFNIATTVVSILAAIAAVASAVFAKRQATAAKEALRFTEEQVSIARATLELERQSRTTLVQLNIDDDKIKQGVLVATVVNQGQIPAEIQGFRATFDDGSSEPLRRWRGDVYNRLPKRLEHGQTCDFEFVRGLEPGQNINDQAAYLPIDFSRGKWRGLTSVEVIANSKPFVAEKGLWISQIINGLAARRPS